MAELGLSCGVWYLLVAACGLLVVACMQDLVPRPGIKPGPPALGVWSLTHWTTRGVPIVPNLKVKFYHRFVCIGKNSIYRVRWYPQFQASTGGLGTYPVWIRRHSFNDFLFCSSFREETKTTRVQEYRLPSLRFGF